MRTLIEPLITVVVFLIRNGHIFLRRLEDGSLAGFEIQLESDVNEVKSTVRNHLDDKTPVRILPGNLNNRALIDGSGENPSSIWVYSVGVFRIDERFGKLESYDKDSVPYEEMNPLHAFCLRSAPFFTEDGGEPIRSTIQ